MACAMQPRDVTRWRLEHPLVGDRRPRVSAPHPGALADPPELEPNQKPDGVQQAARGRVRGSIPGRANPEGLRRIPEDCPRRSHPHHPRRERRCAGSVGLEPFVGAVLLPPGWRQRRTRALGLEHAEPAANTPRGTLASPFASLSIDRRPAHRVACQCVPQTEQPARQAGRGGKEQRRALHVDLGEDALTGNNSFRNFRRGVCVYGTPCRASTASCGPVLAVWRGDRGRGAAESRV